MRRSVSIAVAILLLVYIFSYVWLHQSRIEIWEQDGNPYVIFPAEQIHLYYLYRPLTYLDGNITGMKFHIGQHN